MPSCEVKQLVAWLTLGWVTEPCPGQDAMIAGSSPIGVDSSTPSMQLPSTLQCTARLHVSH